MRAGACAALVALALVGCATPTTTRLGAQYLAPDVPQEALRGAAILVVCNGADRTLELICESQFSARLVALGTKPLTQPALASPTPGREAPAGAFIGPAQAAGAHAVLNVTLTPDFSTVSTGPTFSFGIGGFGGSSGSRAVGGGVGVTLPAGTPLGGAGLAAIASFVDVASGRVLWSTRAVVPPASDSTTMLAEAARALTGAAAQAGLF